MSSPLVLAGLSVVFESLTPLVALFSFLLLIGCHWWLSALASSENMPLFFLTLVLPVSPILITVMPWHLAKRPVLYAAGAVAPFIVLRVIHIVSGA